ncbi:hypothetical protein N0H69_09285 [Yersinia alsatica]|uniref:Uncharacterized protein n=3 Tax=Yersinia alsatica TaxID=2890317 RepID=A0ABY5UU16_9GAMM|nr:hypothetical protein [Yersinia alsatica]OWF68721.1 hypothetical protein B4901_10980 [Yersinia frederiksenii]UWM46973.1 hypothetical protein N0H69_09285 [Yersinia alsatica]CNL19481.1 Uncharacterised protein [Yersinia frederiksenii]CNL30787.1 Uncharacterised protein [Yersinia frederiksenii]
MKGNHQSSENNKEETNSNNGAKAENHSNSEVGDRSDSSVFHHHDSDDMIYKDTHDPLFGNGNAKIKNRDDSDTTIKEIIIKKGTSNDDIEVDLSKNNYVISDAGGTDTLTMINVKKEDLEYSTKNGRYYIRDKKSQNILILDNPTYAEYKQKVSKIEFELNEIIQENKTFKLNGNYEHPINTKNKNKHNSHEYFKHENAVELNNRHEYSIHNFFTMQSAYKDGDVISRDLSSYATYISKQLDEHIEIAAAYNDNEAVAVFTARKEAFSNYADLLLQSDDANHGTVVEKVIIEGITYDVKKLLVSDSVDNLNHAPVQDIAGTTNIAGVKMLKDSVTDYKNWAEVEAITEEMALSNTTIEYMAGFKDLGQQLGIQRLPTHDEMTPMTMIFPEAV